MKQENMRRIGATLVCVVIISGMFVMVVHSSCGVREPVAQRNIAITHEGGGRLGDQLLFYCVAKYISLKYDIPFFFKPFRGHDYFALSKYEKPRPAGFERGYAHKIVIREIPPVDAFESSILAIATSCGQGICDAVVREPVIYEKIPSYAAAYRCRTCSRHPSRSHFGCCSRAQRFRWRSGPRVDAIFGAIF